MAAGNDVIKGGIEEKCKTPHNKTIVIPDGGCVRVCARAGICFVVCGELCFCALTMFFVPRLRRFPVSRYRAHWLSGMTLKREGKKKNVKRYTTKRSSSRTVVVLEHVGEPGLGDPLVK